MNKKNSTLNIRWFYLGIGVIAMLFAGVLYAWSILKTPLTIEFGWSASQLALNFTIAMSFFCIGGLLGAQISKRLGHKIALIIAGIMSAFGFVLTSSLHDTSVILLYISYGVFAGMDSGEMILSDDKGHKIPLTCSFTQRQKDILKAGGLLAYTKG